MRGRGPPEEEHATDFPEIASALWVVEWKDEGKKEEGARKWCAIKSHSLGLLGRAGPSGQPAEKDVCTQRTWTRAEKEEGSGAQTISHSGRPWEGGPPSRQPGGRREVGGEGGRAGAGGAGGGIGNRITRIESTIDGAETYLAGELPLGAWNLTIAILRGSGFGAEPDPLNLEWVRFRRGT